MWVNWCLCLWHPSLYVAASCPYWALVNLFVWEHENKTPAPGTVVPRLCIGAHQNHESCSCFERLSCCFHRGKQLTLWFCVPPSLCLHFNIFVLCQSSHTLPYYIFIFNSLFVSLLVYMSATVSCLFLCLWVRTNGDRYCGLNPQKEPQRTFWFIPQCFSDHLTNKTFSKNTNQNNSFFTGVPAQHVHETFMWIFQLSSSCQCMTMPKRQRRSSRELLGKLKTEHVSLKMIEKARAKEKKISKTF